MLQEELKLGLSLESLKKKTAVDPQVNLKSSLLRIPSMHNIWISAVEWICREGKLDHRSKSLFLHVQKFEKRNMHIQLYTQNLFCITGSSEKADFSIDCTEHYMHIAACALFCSDICLKVWRLGAEFTPEISPSSDMLSERMKIT